MSARKQAVLTKLVLSCEHGGNKIPVNLKNTISIEDVVLKSHRGHDIGALQLFNYLQPLADFSISNEVSRLLIDLNRSRHNSNLFSEYSKALTSEEKQCLVEEHYQTYRDKTENWIRSNLGVGQKIIHFSIHSFTPVLRGKKRNADLAFLYDPKRRKEGELCNTMADSMRQHYPKWKVRMNYPYKGTSDGFTTYLRKKFGASYLGIEIEVNQIHYSKIEWVAGLEKALKATIKDALKDFK